MQRDERRDMARGALAIAAIVAAARLRGRRPQRAQLGVRAEEWHGEVDGLMLEGVGLPLDVLARLEVVGRERRLVAKVGVEYDEALQAGELDQELFPRLAPAAVAPARALAARRVGYVDRRRAMMQPVLHVASEALPRLREEELPPRARQLLQVERSVATFFAEGALRPEELVKVDAPARHRELDEPRRV